MTTVLILDSRAGLETLGLIPMFVSEEDPRPAREQFDDSYAHGGGWKPFKGFKYNPVTAVLSYPGDPPMKPIASITIRDELILIYPYAWVMILQANGDFEISRMD